jgi:tetratricopeptide (TPR) repeat protein
VTHVRDGTGLRDSAHALMARGAWTELADLFDGRADEVRGQPELATMRGETYLHMGRPREGLEWLDEMLPAIERAGDRSALRRAVNIVGVAQFQLGELTAAAPCFERAIELGRQDGDDLLIARATNNLGAIANTRAQREEALGLYARAVTAYQRIGNSKGLAESYHNMAITFRDIGDLVRSDECEIRAIEFAREANNPLLIAQARLGRAEISFLNGDAAFAEVAAQRAAQDFASLTAPIHESDALRLVGVAALARRKLDLAHESLDAALELAQAHGGALNEAEILKARAEYHCVVGDRNAMRCDARAAIAIFNRLSALHDRESLADWLRRNDK